jgi:hypothetical protein
MPEPSINFNIMEYMVWVIEVVAARFYGGDKTSAYNALKDSGMWHIYIEHYDTTHTLSKEYIIDEIGQYFSEHGVMTIC